VSGFGRSDTCFGPAKHALDFIAPVVDLSTSRNQSANENRPKIKLINAAADEFTLEGISGSRVRFVRDQSGTVTELNVLNRSNEWETSKKEKQ